MEESTQPFFRSVPGRIQLVAFGTLFVGGGIGAAMTGLTGIGVVAFAAIISIVLAIFGIGLAAAEHTEATLLGLIGLPFALFLGSLAIWMAFTYASTAGLLIAAIGAVGFAIGIVPRRSREAKTADSTVFAPVADAS